MPAADATPAVAAPKPAREGVSRRAALVVLAFATGGGLLLFGYRYLEVLTSGGQTPWRAPLVNELTGAWSSGLLFFGVRALARRHPLEGRAWYRRVPAHLLGLVAFGASATTLMWASRSLLYPLLGLGSFDYGRMPLRYLMEFQIQVIGYALMVGGVQLADRWRAERERALRLAQLEAQLTRARLQNLELQLQPHFLFNALNTISSTMYDDAEAADEMIGHLAELLRLALRANSSHEVALRDELAALDHYASLMRARFGARLQLRLEIDPATLALRVPSLVLQPLVENAVRHGGAEATGEGSIVVRARRAGSWLQLEVQDHGPGTPEPTHPGSGRGLALTRERLQLLYGSDQRFDAGATPDAGFLVALALPARPADAGAA